MRLLAPAKINLHLRVGRRRDDGFHPLLSWMCTVGLFDTLTLEVDPHAVFEEDAAAATSATSKIAGTGAAAGLTGSPPTAVSDDAEDLATRIVALDLCGDGDRPDLPRDGRNLVVRIATAFVRELRLERQRARTNNQRAAPAPPPPPRPAFRKEGIGVPSVPPTAWAAAGAGQTGAASAGAAPVGAPGTVREDPSGPGRGRDERDGPGPTGDGAGAVRGAERSGRSTRCDVEGNAGAREENARPAPQAAPDWERRAGIRIALAKRIPIGAGLGGGSSDAAHTLVALDRLLSAGWAAERLSAFAAHFGSDVPFFVSAALGVASAACRGRGEIMRPVERPAARRAVVWSPPFGLSTREVYARFDELGMGHDEALEAETEPDWGAWARLPATELMARLVNDLEPAAFSLRPGLAELRERLGRKVGRIVRMSGSGSSLFALYDAGEEAAAREAARAGEGEGVRGLELEVAPGI